MKKIIVYLVICGMFSCNLNTAGTHEIIQRSLDVITNTIKKHPYKIIGSGVLISIILFYLKYKKSDISHKTSKKSLHEIEQERRKEDLLQLCPEIYKKELEKAFKNPGFTDGNSDDHKTISFKQYMKKISKDEFGIILSLIVAHCENMYALNPHGKGYRFFFKENKYEESQGYHLTALLEQFRSDNKITVPSIFEDGGPSVILNYTFKYAGTNNIDIKAWIQNNPKLFEALESQYKIHLMPRLEDLFHDISRLIKRIKEDKEFSENIQTFKVRENISNLIQNNETMPLVVIYPKAGKKSAQIVLDKVYNLFKNEEGLDLAPRYNEKITSKIYWTQGNGDHKSSSLDQGICDLFYTKNRVCYNDILEKGTDYELKISSQ